MANNSNWARLKSLFKDCDEKEVNAILERNSIIANTERKYINTLSFDQLVEEYISSSEYHLAKQSISYAQLVKLNDELFSKQAEIKALKEEIAEIRRQMPKAFK